MSCLPNSQQTDLLLHDPLSKSRIFHSLQEETEPAFLENRASTNLLQISNTICGNSFKKEQKALNLNKHPSSFSPWNPKHEQFAIQKRFDHMDSIGIKISKELSNKNGSRVQRDSLIRQTVASQDNLQRCCSVFIGQFATSQLKWQRSNKRNRAQSSRKTQLNKKNEEHILLLNFSRGRASERYKGYLCKKDENKSQNRNQSVQVKQLPLSHYELKGDCAENNSDEIRPQQILWKAKVPSIRYKKASRLLKSDKQNQTYEYQDRKKGCGLPSKNCFLPKQSKETANLIHNPFTRMLYRKFINTISVNPKAQVRHCL